MPELGTKMQESINVEEIIGAMNDAFGYDNKLKANTDKDKIIKETDKKIAEMSREFQLNNNTIPDEQAKSNTLQSPSPVPASPTTQMPV